MRLLRGTSGQTLLAPSLPLAGRKSGVTQRRGPTW
jgi:hypothetical protein